MKNDLKIVATYLINKILLAPGLVVFSLFIFILHKNLGATPFQLAVAASIKPLSSLPAVFLGFWFARNTDKARYYLVGLLLLAAIPSLLFLLTDQVWWAITVYFLFLVASKAMVPPWIELAKTYLDRKKQCSLFAFGNAAYYGVNLLLPVLFSHILDTYPESWSLLLSGVSLSQLFLLPLLLFFPKVEREEAPKHTSLIAPFKDEPGFIRYLLLFFAGGSSFVLLQPVLPIYLQDILNLSYKEVALAFSVCKGVAFLVTTPIWASLSSRVSIYLLNVFLLLFSLLYIGSLGAGFVLLAYLFYGALQGGSEQSWTLSGPYFSKEKESIRFTSINYLVGAIRGSVLPFLGMLIWEYFGMCALFVFASVPALGGVLYGLSLAKEEKRLFAKAHS